MRPKEGIQTFFTQRGPGVGDVEPRPAQLDVDATIVVHSIATLLCFQQRIRTILNELENLPVAVATCQHRFLDPEVLLQQAGVCVIGTQPLGINLFEEGLHGSAPADPRDER